MQQYHDDQRAFEQCERAVAKQEHDERARDHADDETVPVRGTKIINIMTRQYEPNQWRATCETDGDHYLTHLCMNRWGRSEKEALAALRLFAVDIMGYRWPEASNDA